MWSIVLASHGTWLKGVWSIVPASDMVEVISVDELVITQYSDTMTVGGGALMRIVS